MSHYWRGVLLILLSALAFGSYGIWSKLLGPYFPTLYQGWVKAIIIAVGLLPFLIIQGQILRIPRSDWFWMTIFLVATSFTIAPIYYAFNTLTFGTALLLFYGSMLLTMYTFGLVFFKEERTWIKIVSLVLALAGLMSVYSLSIALFAILGIAMAILNGVASGTEVASSKKLSGTYSTIYLSWLSWVAIAVTNLIVGIAINEPFIAPSFSIEWAYLLGFAASSFIAFWAVMEGLKYVDASVGGVIGLTEIVFGLFFAWAIFGEALTAQVTIGAVLILLAASLPSLQEIYNKKHA